MATHSKNSAFTYGGTALTSIIDNVSVSWNDEIAETTAIGQSSKTFLSGLKDATISLSGRFETGAGFDGALTAFMNAGTGAIYVYTPGTASVTFTGTALMTSYEVSSPVGDVVAFSAELQSHGAVTKS